MTFDIDKITESKRRYRRKLFALPVAEKLRMLERLREREIAIRNARLSALRDEVISELRARTEAFHAEDRISRDALHERSAVS